MILEEEKHTLMEIEEKHKKMAKELYLMIGC